LVAEGSDCDDRTLARLEFNDRLLPPHRLEPGHLGRQNVGTHLKPVNAGHLNICHYQLKLAGAAGHHKSLLETLNRLLARVEDSAFHLETLQHHFERQQVEIVVITDQDPHLAQCSTATFKGFVLPVALRSLVFLYLKLAAFVVVK
jgi:hypothetical protein